METKTEDLKAFLSVEKPTLERKDKRSLTRRGEIKKIIIRNIYSRRLEDLTFGDLGMLGYTNPNYFVKRWIEQHKTFDSNKVVWVVVYVEDKNE